MEIKNKKVTVVGLARSGSGAANLLAARGASVTVTDIRGKSELMDDVRKLASGIDLVLGRHPDGLLLSSDLIVVSPGVPLSITQIVRAKSEGISVIGEFELAYRILNDFGVPYLAVTGSNGKSTTTTLLDIMLRKGGFQTLFGGNIGNALTEEINGMFCHDGQNDATALRSGNRLPDVVVAEVSSFQLESIVEFRPHVASILNITPDHMDRYHSLSDYSRAKAKIFENQRKNDFLVLNADDAETEKLYESRFTPLGSESKVDKESLPTVFFFSRAHEVEGMFSKNGVLHCNFPHLPHVNGAFMDSEEISIKGVHNLENAMAAAAMALLAGCPAGAVREALRTFQGLEHRLELVRELDGVKYINDSKGTNVGAVLKSIESFCEPLVLIAGGRDKAGDFTALRSVVREKVKALVLIGESAGKIRDALWDLTDTVIAGDLDEAVSIARSKSERGDVVLLSPACASFDMFRDFEDRGRQFKKIVGGLNN
jgi:UDP-N-acetylmuramoylalanine--D-glutamate ligase